MSKRLRIQEQASSLWKVLLLSVAFITTACIAFFLIIDEPLWNSIFKLMAFIGFAVAVLAFLQSRGKSRTIELNLTRQHLVVNYYLTSKKNQEELFDLKTIDRIKKVPAPPAWNIFPRKDCAKFVITFTDTPATLSLFRLQGRDRFVSHADAQKVEHFLDRHFCP